jgi:hypothetical protein
MTIENTILEAVEEKVEEVASKPAVKKVVAKAKKVAPKKTAAKKVEEVSGEIEAEVSSRYAELKGKLVLARNTVQEDSVRFTLAYIGFLGTAYDEVKARLATGNQTRKEAMEQFVARGEKIRDEAQVKVKELKLSKNLDEVKAKFDDISIPTDLNSFKAKFNEVKAKIRPVKEAA